MKILDSKIFFKFFFLYKLFFKAWIWQLDVIFFSKFLT